MHISERHKWYIGFAVFVIIVLLSLSLLHAPILVSIGFITVLAVIAIYDVTQTKAFYSKKLSYSWTYALYT